MKYPIAGIPDSEVIASVIRDNNQTMITYRDSRKVFSKEKIEEIRSIYYKQMKEFVKNGYNPDFYKWIIQIPTILFAAGGAAGLALQYIEDNSFNMVLIGLILAGLAEIIGFIQRSDFKESKQKHDIVRKNMRAFRTNYEYIIEELGEETREKYPEPEDIIFAVDEMPLKLVKEIGSPEQRHPYRFA